MSRPDLNLSSVVFCSLLAACASETTGPTGPAPAAGMAVIHTDYMSASVSLVDPATGAVTRHDCINSGSAAPKLTTALSGDITVPSQPQPANELVIIDRTNATLTWLDPRSCDVKRQLSVSEGFEANPHDLISVSASKGYVTRYAADPGDPGRGSDLLIIDPAAPRVLGRVDLRGHATRGPGEQTILPMPGRGAFVGGKVYVLLNNQSADYKAAGPGRVVVVDPAQDQVVATIDLPDMTNCDGLQAVERTPPALVVSCGGVFADGQRRVAVSGAAWIDLGTTPPTVTKVSGSAFGRAVSPFDLAAFGPELAFTITLGEFKATPPDQLWAFDFEGGAPRLVLEGSAGYTLGGVTVSPATRKVFVTDASDMVSRLVVIDVSGEAPMVQARVTTTMKGLPPRNVGFY
jgi:hypothetical protein